MSPAAGFTYLQVLVVEADYRFEQGDYVAAAQIYAQSPRSFEEVLFVILFVLLTDSCILENNVLCVLILVAPFLSSDLCGRWL